MRQNLLNGGSQKLDYEIRDIVKKAEQLQKLGKKIYWENIGDPILKNAENCPFRGRRAAATSLATFSRSCCVECCHRRPDWARFWPPEKAVCKPGGGGGRIC